MTNITQELFSADAMKEHLDLGSLVYNSAEVIEPSQLIWKHIEIPDGPSTIVCLRDKGGCLKGRTFAQPRKFISQGGVTYSGGIITDFVVSPKQKNPTFVIGITAKMKSLSGFEVIAHTSNEKSELIYRNLFKFPVVFRLSAYGVPIMPFKILGNKFRVPKFFARPLESIDLIFKFLFAAPLSLINRKSKLGWGNPPSNDDEVKIFADFKDHVGPHFERSNLFSEWRFQAPPLFRGKVKWLWKGGRCLGYVAFRSITLNGISFVVIMDPIFSRRLSPFEAINLKLLCISEAYISGSEAIFTMINTSNNALKMLRGFPFIHIPDKFLPHPTPIYIHKKANVLNDNDLSGTFLTLADLDYF